MEELNVLVTGMEDTDADRLSQVLSAEGMRVTTASDRSLLESALKSGSCDALIADVAVVPEGARALREALSLDDDGPMVFVLGPEDASLREEHEQGGAQAYWAKPAEPEAIRRSLESHFHARVLDELSRQRGLAEEKNILLTLQNAELERLNAFKSSVLQRLGDPDKGYIAEMLACTSQIASDPALPAHLKSQVERLSRMGDRVRHVFKPYDFYSQAEAALHGRTILVLDKDRNFRKLTARAVVAAGADAYAVSTPEEALSFLKDKPADALFIDWEHREFMQDALKAQPDVCAIMTTSEPIFEKNGIEMLEMPLNTVLITNVLARTEVHDAMAARELVTTIGKLLTHDVFGVEKYLGWGTAVREQTVTHSNQRRDAVDAVYDYVLQSGLRPRIARNMQVLAEELLMNAIWDAPVDAAGKPKYAYRRRNEPVDLLPSEAVRLRFGTDGNVLALSVEDAFGRLEYERAFGILVKCFAQSGASIHEGPGGAGLGLYMAYNSVSSLVINVDPGKRTEVIGLINLHRMGPGQIGVPTRSFCYFRTP